MGVPLGRNGPSPTFAQRSGLRTEGGGRCAAAHLRAYHRGYHEDEEPVAGRIDYRMARRALLRDVRTGLRSTHDVCDAHPDLVRAGRHVGEPIGDTCPICDEEQLRLVTYVFGRHIGRHSGRVVERTRLDRILQRYGQVNVYTVEVCTECSWHHLRESFWLGREAG